MIAQLSLFAPDAPVRTIGLSPDTRFELAFTEPVKLELLAVAAARADEWLGWNAFRAPMNLHQIGFCMGHVLSSLVRAGRLQEKKIYFGKGLEADRPGSPDYHGYTNEWRAISAPTNDDRSPT